MGEEGNHESHESHESHETRQKGRQKAEGGSEQQLERLGLCLPGCLLFLFCLVSCDSCVSWLPSSPICVHLCSSVANSSSSLLRLHLVQPPAVALIEPRVLARRRQGLAVDEQPDHLRR